VDGGYLCRATFPDARLDIVRRWRVVAETQAARGRGARWRFYSAGRSANSVAPADRGCDRPGDEASPASGVEPADVEQEATTQVCALIREYDASHGTSLPVYVGRLLKWRLVNYLRDEARRASHAPLEAARLEEIADETADMPEPCLVAPRLRRALRKLSPRQRAVIVGIYWRQRTARQVADELGLTKQAASGARRKAEEILRRELESSVR
jgi:RNA polymerase sigma factor (sigma-70 family)